MEQFIDFPLIRQLASDILAWTQAHILVIPNLMQITLVILAYVLARTIESRLQLILGKVLDGSWGGDWVKRYRSQLDVMLMPLVMPMSWLMMVGTAQLAARQLSWPGAIFEIGVSLLTAWVIIRLVLNFIVDPWWSRAVAISVWTVAALDIVGLLDPTLAFMDLLAVNMGDFRLSLLGVAKTLFALIAFLWLANAAARLVERRLRALPHLTPSLQVLFGKLIRVLFIAIAILVAMNSVGVDLTALTVFSGALGLGVGLGLQKVVANLFSGIILLLDRSVKPGDVIAINNTYGWINSIGARYVSVVTRDGIEHLIPNEELINLPVENWSHSNNNVRLRLPFGVSYECDLHQAIELAIEAASSFDRILKAPQPQCLVKSYGESSVDLELRVWINDAAKGVSNIKSQIYLKVWDLYQENGVHFPYAQRDLHIRGPIKVEIDR
ncbi:MAG: mechanosensitive ion channel protein MscS [Rhodospirillaceae bacterium]|nr:MAG: mechanosensitive ion channel protein MscS [Rhodospirillaceae bacterium]